MPDCPRCREVIIPLFDYQTGEMISVNLEAHDLGDLVVYDPEIKTFKRLTAEEIIEAKQLGIFLFIDHRRTCRCLNNGYGYQSL